MLERVVAPGRQRDADTQEHDWPTVGGLESERDEVRSTEKLPRWRNVLVTAQDVARVVARLQRLEARE
jgi:hypothetical protein